MLGFEFDVTLTCSVIYYNRSGLETNLGERNTQIKHLELIDCDLVFKTRDRYGIYVNFKSSVSLHKLPYHKVNTEVNSRE